MEDFTAYFCLSSVCIGPVVLFALGYAIGSGRIRFPFRLRIERKVDDYNVQLED